jgi:phage-related protein
MAEGFKIADAYVEIEAELDRDRLADTVASTVSKAAPRIKATAGKKLGSSLLEGITDSFGAGFKSAVSLGFSGLTGLGSALASNPITATIGVALGLAIAAPMIGAIAAALTSGLGLLAGVGILGIGALILKDNAKLKKSFENTFGSIKKILERAAKPLIGPFLTGLKAIEKIFKALEPDLTAIFKAAAPIVPILTKAFGDLLGPVLKGIKDAMPGILAAFEGVGAAMPGLGEAIGNFFRTIFENKDLIKRLSEQFVDFFTFLINIAGPAINIFTVLWGAFTNIIEMSVKGWGMGLSAISTAFDNFTNGGLSRITAAWAPLKTAIMKVWDALVAFASADTDEELATTFETLVQRIKEAWGPLKTFIGTVWDEVWAFVKKIWNEKVVPWWENTAKPWLMTQIKAGVKAAFEAAWAAIKAEVGSWPGKIATELGKMVDKAKTTVTTGFAGAGSWLLQAGKSILQGLIDGITSKISSLKSLLSTVTGLIPDFKGPMSVDKKLLFPTGEAIMGGLESGMTAGVSSLERTLQGLTSAIPSMVPAPQAAPAGGPSLIINNPVFFGAGSKDEFIRWMNDELDRLRRSHR